MPTVSYCGATGRMGIKGVSKLSPDRYRLQIKHDGVYVRIHTDWSGRVCRVLSRYHRKLKAGDDLLGIKVVPGPAILIGELEAHTEAGIAARDAKGYSNVHLFDIITNARYEERLDYLWRGVAQTRTPQNMAHTTDSRGNHKGPDGRFIEKAGPKDWRRFSIVETLPLTAADELWDRALAEDIEGLVVVNMKSKLRSRNAKRKVKPVDTLDCVVVRACKSAAILRTFGGVFTVSCKGLNLDDGDTVEVMHNGYYKSGVPRFPRIVRKRTECPNKRPSSSMSSGQGQEPRLAQEQRAGGQRQE